MVAEEDQEEEEEEEEEEEVGVGVGEGREEVCHILDMNEQLPSSRSLHPHQPTVNSRHSDSPMRKGVQ